MKTGKRMLSMILVVLLLIAAVPSTTIPNVKATTENYQVGDIIEFGSYPQSRVTNKTIINSLNALPADWQYYDYYVGVSKSNWPGFAGKKDYMSFADVAFSGERYRGVKFTEYRPEATYYCDTGTYYQQKNGYYTNTIYWFKYEPIKWRVINPSEGLVVSEIIIDSQAFCNTVDCRYDSFSTDYYYNDYTHKHFANNYAVSSIREWLNSSLWNDAFSDSEKQKIGLTTISNNCSVETKKREKESTEDYLFLLSYDDLQNVNYGFNASTIIEDDNARAQGSDYAKCQGLRVDSGFSPYRLRSSNSANHAYIIDANGLMELNGAILANISIGIRPAMCIDLDHLNEAQEPVVKYLSDYQPGYDKFGFKNEYAPAGAADSISIDYYMDVFGVFLGGILYSEHEDGLKHGVCFGMAASSSMFAQHRDKLSSLYKMNDDTAIQLKQLADADNPFTAYSTWSGTTLETIIKRAHVYQLSQKVAKERNENVDSLRILWDAVKDSVDKGEMPVIVDVYNGTYQQKENYHSVLAVGYVELDEDYVIILDNPNYLYGPNQEFSACILIKKDFSAWEMLYLDRNKGLQYTEYSSEKGGLTFNYADVTRAVSTPSLLTMDSKALLIKANELFNTNKTVFPIYATNGDDTGNTNLYWTDEDVNDISLTTTKNTKVSVSSYYSTLGATLPASSTFDSTFEDRNAEAVIDTDAGSPMELTVSRVGEANRLETITISGTAENGDIQIQSDEDKITIDGLNDITATLEKDNIAKSASVSVSDGRSVNITIDEQNNDVILTHEHDYKTTVKSATCTAEGSTTYTCSICGDTYSEPIKKLDHQWNGGTITTQPTCATAGVKTFQCVNCTATRTEPVAALGHAWSGWTITKQPTCTQEGQQTRTCTRDGSHKETQQIAKKAHADNGNGYCKDCGTDMKASQRCKYCHQIHTGPFGWLIKFFHSILAIFKR